MKNVNHIRNVKRSLNVKIYNIYYENGEKYGWSNLYIKIKTFRYF